ncbi:MAG: hypothetical protein U0802_10950 [Candidatus Binatia bacterium]
MSDGVAAAAVDGGGLALGGGLLALLRPALDRLAPGGVLALLSSAPALRDDLPAWCRLEQHRYLGCAAVAGRDRHPDRRRRARPAAAAGTRQRGAAGGAAAHRRGGAGGVAHAGARQPGERLAPRGVAVEPGGPPPLFTLLDRDPVAPPEVAALYDQAVAGQWDAERDIAWRPARRWRRRSRRRSRRR